MPDHSTDEETKTRRRSLCLFGVPGITLTNNRRCENCPGAARTPQFHQSRCPLDLCNEHNLFVQAAGAQAGKSEIIVDPKLLASSSSGSSSNAVQHVIEDIAAEMQHVNKTIAPETMLVQHVAENVVVGTISVEVHDLWLDEKSAEVCPRVNIVSPTTDRSVSDSPVEVIGRKRKADHRPESSSRNELAALQDEEFVRSPKRLQRTESELAECLHSLSIGREDDHPGRDIATALSSLNQPEDLLRTEQASAFSTLANFAAEVNARTRLSGDQLDGRSDVQEFLRNKEQPIFQDLPCDEPALGMMDWGINAGRDASRSSLFDNPTAMQAQHDPDLPVLVSSLRICIPGIAMITQQRGVPFGSDRVFNANDPQEFDFMSRDMEIVGPSHEELMEERS